MATSTCSRSHREPDDPRPGRPDQRRRLVQRRRRGRAAQGRDCHRRHRPGRLRPRHRVGTGLTSTADNTLRRKAAIEAGDTNGADAFDPASSGTASPSTRSRPRHTRRAAADVAPSVRQPRPRQAQRTSRPLPTSRSPSASRSTRRRLLLDHLRDQRRPHRTVSGGPTTFTLDPTADFAGGETCTVTIVAASVTDQDTHDPPEHGRRPRLHLPAIARSSAATRRPRSTRSRAAAPPRR